MPHKLPGDFTADTGWIKTGREPVDPEADPGRELGKDTTSCKNRRSHTVRSTTTVIMGNF